MMRAVVTAFLCAALCSADTAGSELLKSSPHTIDCWNNGGAMVRHYENDPRGLYYGTAGHIIFLDKADGKMTRLAASSCVEKWDAAKSY